MHKKNGSEVLGTGLVHLEGSASEIRKLEAVKGMLFFFSSVYSICPHPTNCGKPCQYENDGGVERLMYVAYDKTNVFGN